MSASSALPLQRVAARAIPRATSLQPQWICNRCHLEISHRASDASRLASHRWGLSNVRHATALSAPSSNKTQSTLSAANNDDGLSLSLESLQGLLKGSRSSPSTLERRNLHDPYGLSLALRSRNPSAIWASAMEASADSGYIKTIPKTTWTEVLLALDPRKILPLHRIQRSFNNEQLKSLGYDHTAKTQTWQATLSELFSIRRRQHRLDLSDYRIVLQHAASGGSLRTASYFWKAMKLDGIQPDRLCYNAYLEAHVWQESLRLKQGYRARSPLHYDGPKPLDVMLFRPGQGIRAVEILEDMRRQKISPDTATYCAVIAALARDGELAKTWPILSEQWGVDTKAMVQGKLPGAPQIIQPRTSATYPTQELLTVLIDAFGSNNQILCALHLLVFFSRVYGLQVSEPVCYQLAKWTWLQARVKPNERTNRSTYTPSFESIRQVANYITANIKSDPSMDQLHIFFKSAGISIDQSDFDENNRRGLKEHLRLLERGRQQYLRSMMLYQKAADRVVQIEAQNTLAPTSGVRLQAARDQCARRKLKRQMAHQLLLRWSRELISFRTAFDMSGQELRAWQLRGLPQFLLFYGVFCPSQVKYKVDGGTVELEFRTEAQIQRARARKALAERTKSYHAVKKMYTSNAPPKKPASRAKSVQDQGR